MIYNKIPCIKIGTENEHKLLSKRTLNMVTAVKLITTH